MIIQLATKLFLRIFLDLFPIPNFLVATCITTDRQPKSIQLPFVIYCRIKQLCAVAFVCSLACPDRSVFSRRGVISGAFSISACGTLILEVITPLRKNSGLATRDQFECTLNQLYRFTGYIGSYTIYWLYRQLHDFVNASIQRNKMLAIL